MSVSLIKLYKEGSNENEFDGYFFSNEDEDANSQREGIMQYNVVRDIVGRYASAVKLFDETLEASRRINDMARYPDDKEYNYIPIKFGTMKNDGHGAEVTHQQYKKSLQKYYWHIIFNKLDMDRFATKKLREQINRFVEKQINVPFTMANIYRVIDMVLQTNEQRMRQALLEAFDLICSFSADNSTAGEKWKTNSNYMVNRKFIVPWMTSYNSYGYKSPYVRLAYNGSSDEIEDVCKALCYITGVDYGKVSSLDHITRMHPRNGFQWGEWFEWGFFRCKGYKKGTMHFEFLDEDVWYRFNYEVARMRGWELPKATRGGKRGYRK